MPEPTTPAAAAAWLASYRGRTAAFARDVLRLESYRHQERIYDAADAGDRIAVRAGRGVGKSFAAEVVAVAFVATRPQARVLITGPQFENSVVNNLIPGIHALLLRSPLLSGMFTVTTSAVFARSDALKRAWGITGVASETPQFIEGAHAASCLWIIDEAASVARQVFISAIGGLTQGPDNRILLIGTPPLVKAGYFHAVFEGEAGSWTCLTISALDAVAPHGPVSPDRIAEARRTLGEESPEWASQILGVPADRQRETLVPMAHYHAAVRRHPRFTGDRQGEAALPGTGAVVLALDPSGGGDEAIVAVRWGSSLMALHKLDGRSEAAMAAGVDAIVQDWNAAHPLDPVTRIVCERGGFGRGCVETLRKAHGGRVVTTWDPSGSPREDTVGNARAEIWINLAVLLEREEIALLADERLEQDLAAIGRRTGDNGKTYVTKKEELVAALGRSPDRGDAVALVFSGYRPGKGDSAGAVPPKSLTRLSPWVLR
jgi:phage terminase large subunit